MIVLYLTFPFHQWIEKEHGLPKKCHRNLKHLTGVNFFTWHSLDWTVFRIFFRSLAIDWKPQIFLCSILARKFYVLCFVWIWRSICKISWLWKSLDWDSLFMRTRLRRSLSIEAGTNLKRRWNIELGEFFD